MGQVMANKLCLRCARFPPEAWPPACIFRFHATVSSTCVFSIPAVVIGIVSNSLLHQHHPHCHFNHSDLIRSKVIDISQVMPGTRFWFTCTNTHPAWNTLFFCQLYLAHIFPLVGFFPPAFCSITVWKIRKSYEYIRTIHLAFSAQPELNIYKICVIFYCSILSIFVHSNLKFYI